MLAIFLIAGFILAVWAVIAYRREARFQREIQQTVARNQQEQLEIKVLREEGRERRTSVQEWEKEFKVLDATQFFNPRRGSRPGELNFERHNYKAEIEPCVNETGLRFRRLAVSDAEGKLVKIQFATDNAEATAYRECIISESSGRVIGGWQLAHQKIPYEFAAASINLGYYYSHPLDLPTTVPIGYVPHPFLAGSVVLVRYKFRINAGEKEFPEDYLEDHFAEIFPDGGPGRDVAFRKSGGMIHFCRSAEPRVRLTPEEHAAEVKRLNDEFRRKNPQLYLGVPANESLVEWAIKKAQPEIKTHPAGGSLGASFISKQETGTSAPQFSGRGPSERNCASGDRRGVS